MRIEFDIVTGVDAARAARVTAAVSDVWDGESVPATATRRSPKPSKVAEPAPVAAVADPRPAADLATVADPEGAPASDLAAQYNAIAEATGAKPLPAEKPQDAGPVDPHEEASGLESPTEPEAAPFDRAATESAVKKGCIDKGIVWVRDNVMTPYGVKKVSDLTDAQMAAVAAKLESGN
jgi:hypothetical protein